MLPSHDLPPWVESAATLLLGAGAAKMLSVWLENRRLGRQEYRETLLNRVRELEKDISALQDRVGDLRAEQARLEERLEDEQREVERLRHENDELRCRLEDLSDDEDDDVRESAG